MIAAVRAHQHDGHAVPACEIIASIRPPADGSRRLDTQRMQNPSMHIFASVPALPPGASL